MAYGASMTILQKMHAELEEAVRAAEIDIRNRQQGLKTAEQRLETTKARLEGFRVALDAMGNRSPIATEAHQFSNVVTVRLRNRQLTGHWRKIMQTVHGGDFGYQDLITAAALVGHKVGKETLRSQMSGYKRAGIVEGVENGLFRITPYGMQAAGISKEANGLNENGAPEGAPEAGGGATPPKDNRSAEEQALF